MALSHSPRSDCEKREKGSQIATTDISSVLENQSNVLTCYTYTVHEHSRAYWDIFWQPFRDVQVVYLYGDFFAVAWFRDSDGSEILQPRKTLARIVARIIQHITHIQS